jgi:hypothetical protein
MKTKLINLFLVVATIITLCSSSFAFTRTYTIGNGGVLQWNGKEDETCTCSSPGNNCNVTISYDHMVCTDLGNSWQFTGHVSGVTASIFDPNHSPFNTNLSTNYYVHPAGYIQILGTDFPGVPSMQIVLTGIATNSSGYFTVIVPK